MPLLQTPAPGRLKAQLLASKSCSRFGIVYCAFRAPRRRLHVGPAHVDATNVAGAYHCPRDVALSTIDASQ